MSRRMWPLRWTRRTTAVDRSVSCLWPEEPAPGDDFERVVAQLEVVRGVRCASAIASKTWNSRATSSRAGRPLSSGTRRSRAGDTRPEPSALLGRGAHHRLPLSRICLARRPCAPSARPPRSPWRAGRGREPRASAAGWITWRPWRAPSATASLARGLSSRASRVRCRVARSAGRRALARSAMLRTLGALEPEGVVPRVRGPGQEHGVLGGLGQGPAAASGAQIRRSGSCRPRSWRSGWWHGGGHRGRRRGRDAPVGATSPTSPAAPGPANGPASTPRPQTYRPPAQRIARRPALLDRDADRHERASHHRKHPTDSDRRPALDAAVSYDV
jgi:hypothetical protein